LRYVVPATITIPLTVLLSTWTEIPMHHSLALGTLIPLLVMMGRRTGDYVAADLGVEEDALSPGRGQILDNLKSLLFVGPVVFHYIRYFLK
jgi:predicted CDP-diglyceride synthetase/phosphatidate cytidylyltransferase